MFLAIGVAALLAIGAVTLFPIARHFVLRIWLPMIVAALTTLAAIGSSSIFRRFWKVAPTLRPVDRLLRDFLIGYPICGGIFFLIGLVSTAAAPMAGALVALAATGVAATYASTHAATNAAPLSAPLSDRIDWRVVVAVGLAGAGLFWCVAVAQLPAVTLDELAYHLAVVKTWVLEGRVVELPLISHSYFPFGSEAAALPALSLLRNDGAISAHLIHLASVIAVIWLLYRWLRVRTSAPAAAVACAAIATTPAIAITAGFTGADWPLLGAVLVLLMTLESASHSDEMETTDVALSIAAGLLTKYTFVAVAVPLIAAFVWSKPSFARRLVKPVLLGAVGGSIFMIWNAIKTGNPVAPFFGGSQPAVYGFHGQGGWVDSLRTYVFDPVLTDESLGLGLLGLILIGVVGMAGRHVGFESRAAIVVSLAGLALIALRPTGRILVPTLTVLAALSVVASDHVFRNTKTARAALDAALLVVATAQLLIVVSGWSSLEPFAISTGLSDEQYLARQRLYREISWADSRLPEESRTLVVGLNALYWFDHHVRGGGNFDGPRISEYLEEGSVDSLRRRLADDGISHVAIFARGLRPAQGPFRERFTAPSQRADRNLADLIRRYGHHVASSEDIFIYRLR